MSEGSLSERKVRSDDFLSGLILVGRGPKGGNDKQLKVLESWGV